MEDGRGRLGLGGRRELVRLVEEGLSLRSAARRLGVAPATLMSRRVVGFPGAGRP